MSKKKRAAKAAKKKARDTLLRERTAAALEELRALFPNPYTHDADFARDRSIRQSVIAREYPGRGPDYVPPLLHSVGDEVPTFQVWVLRFRDALLSTGLRVDDVDARVRYQLADDLQLRERARPEDRHALRYDTFRVMGRLIACLPLDWPSNTPYDSAAAADADVVALREAWRLHFKLSEVSPDFLPRLYTEEDARHALIAAPWVAVFHDLLVEKYGSIDAAEPHFQFMLAQLDSEVAFRAGEGIPPSDDPG